MKSRGFTLIELIGVISVFALIIITASDLFISMVRQQRRILNHQELLNQTSYLVEYMSRALRMAREDINGSCLDTTGFNYELTTGPAGCVNCVGIKFINHSDNDICQEFFWDQSDPLNKTLKEIKSGGSAVLLISDRLQVNYFNILISGDESGDWYQPRVTLSMEIQVKNMPELKKEIQATISQRNLDAPQ